LRRCVAALLLGLLLLPWYGLVSTRGSGPAVEQTLRLGPLYYANLWMSAALMLGAALLLSRLVPPGALDRGWKWSERTLLAPASTSFALGLAAVAFLGASWVSAGVLDGRPALLDGVAQQVQARYLGGGALSGPRLEHPEFWQFQFMVSTERGWVSQYPPGFTAVLSLGARLGVPWLVGPALLAVAIFVATLVAERLFRDDRTLARLGAALAALSPMLAFHAGGSMSHVLALALAAAALLASLRAAEKGWPWALLAGAALGALFATRPYTALVFGGVALTASGAAIGSARAELRAWAAKLLAAVAGAVPFVAAVLLYNRHYFGSPLRFGYEAAEGPGHRIGFHPDPWGSPYGLLEALGYTSADLQALSVELLQVPAPTLLLVGSYLLLAPRVSAGVSLAAVWALLPALAHALYWHHDLFMGPRLLYESVPAWCLLLAASAVASVRALPPSGWRFLRVGLLTRSGLAATWTLALAVGVLYAGPRKLASYGSEAARSGMSVAAPTVVRPALVFVHGSWEDRMAARLDAAGMRLDSIRLALANNPSCRIELSLRRRGDDARPTGAADSDATDRSASSRVVFHGPPDPGLRELRMPSGSVIRAYPGETLDPVCEQQASSDFGGVLGLPPLLLQGDLPGLAGDGAMFVRDLGPEHNRELIQRFPERERLLLVRRDGALRMLPYEEGIAALWSSPPASAGTVP
jgi:hypothetical protein